MILVLTVRFDIVSSLRRGSMWVNWWLELGVYGKLVMGDLEIFWSDRRGYSALRGRPPGRGYSASDAPCLLGSSE